MYYASGAKREEVLTLYLVSVYYNHIASGTNPSLFVYFCCSNIFQIPSSMNDIWFKPVYPNAMQETEVDPQKGYVKRNQMHNR